jgi:catalase
VPDAGVEHLDDAVAKAKAPDFLFDELKARVTKGPISFQIWVQVADDRDVVNDATIHWPESRPLVNFGKLVLTQQVADSLHEQKHIIFDPIPRVEGIEASADPLLELRAAIYLLSGRRRRAAPESQAASTT